MVPMRRRSTATNLSPFKKNTRERSAMPRSALSRRQFTALGAAAVAAVAAPSLHAQARPEKQKITIAVSGKAAFCYLPLTIAEQLGYFKIEGLDVEVVDVTGGARALEGLTAGA